MRWQATTTKRLLFWAVPATALLAFLAGLRCAAIRSVSMSPSSREVR